MGKREHGGNCPGCNRIMSIRECDEQGVCNECLDFYSRYFAAYFDTDNDVAGFYRGE